MADIRINALTTTATTPASDDYLALDGTAQGTRKILATNIANNVTDVILGSSGPSVKSSLSARAPRQGLVFDGTAGATVSGSGITLGSTNYTCAFWVNQSSYTGAENRVIGSDGNGAFEVQLNRSANGDISVIKSNTAVVFTTSVLLVNGKWQFVAITKSGTSATVYVNGVSSASATDSQTYTGASTVINSILGTKTMPGALVGPYIYNRALSAAEVVALYEAGAPSGADYNSASSTNIITGDAWYTTVQGGTAISSGVATITTPGNLLGRANAVTVGKRYRVSVNITASTGGAAVRLYEITTGTNRVIGSSAGTNTLEFTATSAGQYFNISAGTATFDTISIIPLGLLLAPDAAQAGGGLTWYDTSGNAANISWTSGVSWNVPTSGRGIFANGTVAAPSIAFSAYPAVGFYLSGPSEVNLGLGNGTYRAAQWYQSGPNSYFTIFAPSSATQYLTLQSTASGQFIVAGGTNQNITLTPSGTGNVVADAGFILNRVNAKGIYTGTSDNCGFTWTGTNGEFSTASGSLILKSAGTTALTLDSSQNATFSRQVLAGAGFVLGWNGRGHLIAPSDGVITLLNAASNDFNRLQFGGTTASFPSLKRSTSVLTCVLADDSAFATFRALDFSAQGAATTVGANQVSYGGTTATTATAGAQTLPANPVGFIIVNVAGTTAKIPYYAN